MNVPLVLTIILLPRLRERKEFAMIAGLAIGDLIYTVGYMAVSIRRIFEIDYDRNGKWIFLLGWRGEGGISSVISTYIDFESNFQTAC